MSVLLELGEVGDIVIDLLTEQAPRTCENFLKLCVPPSASSTSTVGRWFYLTRLLRKRTTTTTTTTTCGEDNVREFRDTILIQFPRAVAK